MFIVPIQPLSGLDELQRLGRTQGVQEAGAAAQNPFQSMVMDAIQNVKTSGAEVNKEIELLATGQTDSLHAAIIASNKYTTSVDLMVQMRNKALDAYNELMRIGV